MNNWTKNELKEIKKILYTKANFTFNNDKYIVTIKKEDNTNYKQLISLFSDELVYGTEILLNSNNKDDINKILTKCSKVEFDSNNRLHYGLISFLSKIHIPKMKNDNLKELIMLASTSEEKDSILSKKDELYYTQIFTLLKELIGQYDRITNYVITKSFKDLNEPEIIKEKIAKISNDLSEEEIETNFLLQKIFNTTNGLNTEPFFKEIIEKCNSKIKSALISRANTILATVVKEKEKASLQDAREHHGDFNKKFRHKIQGTVRKYNGGYFYGRN